MNKIYLFSFVVLFLTTQPAFADMKAANDALARGDLAVAAAEFQKLAEQGDKNAQSNLGYMYYVGEGVEQNYVKAVKWYRKAAILGDRDSQYNLAVAYAFGEGVKQDYKDAFLWYRRAAEQNHAIAQYSLGVSYAYGEGVAQNPELAAEWFKKSAEQGYERAQVLLGSLYHTGDGVEKDYQQAVFWYRKAADKGDAAAQYNLGTLYRAGNGVEQDYNQAVRWFRLSADQGYAAAQNELASMERAITGANRPAPASVTEDESTQAETVTTVAEESTQSIPTLVATTPVKTEPEPEAVVNEGINKPETNQSPAPDDNKPDIGETTTEGDEPKQGFFSRLFGKKDTSNSTPEQSDVVYVTPEEIAAADNSYMSTLGGQTVIVEKIVTPEPEPKPEPVETKVVVTEEPVEPESVETEVAETEEPAEPETIETPAPDDNKPDIGETTTEGDEAPKRGFFARLFGKKDTSNSTPEQSDVVYATPEEIAAAEKGYTPTARTEIEVPEEITSEETVTPEPEPVEPESVETEVSETEEVVKPETIQSPAPDTNKSDVSETVTEGDEAPKRGFFSRLFGKKDTSNSTPEQSSIVDTTPEEVTEQSTNESSEVITYAADSAPVGQQLKASSGIETTTTEPDPVETATQLPADTPLSEPELTVEDETKTGIKVISDDKIDKKEFFSNLFDSKDNAAENSSSEEVVEIDNSEEPVVVAKLEEPEEDDSIEKESEEVLIDSADVTPDVINTGVASDIRPLAVKGDAKAQFQLGALYYQGKGVKQDYTQAFLWYRRAAQQGDSDAQYSLGNMYLMGEGIKQDDYQARQWYEKAAEQGHEGAQHNLESLQRIATEEPEPEYDTNDNKLANNLPEQDGETLEEPKEKKGFFSKLFGKDDADEEELDEAGVSTEDIVEIETTSEQISSGSSEATNNSAATIYEKGLAFEFGEGVPQNYRTAFELFRKSADQNYAPAQYKLGLAYAYGQGAEKDPATAAEWYKKSADQGYALAQRTLATLYISGEGVEQNRLLALAWFNILADSGNVMDVHRRDALKEKLTPDEIDEANILKQELLN